MLTGLLARHSGDSPDDVWTLVCEQVGVSGLAVPEEYDGAGATLAESAVALEEVAYTLAPSPLLASTLAAAALLLHGDDTQRAELLPRIAAGETATVLLEPPLLLEPDAAVVLVPTRSGLVLADRPREPLDSLDPTLRLGRLDAPASPSTELRDVATSLATAVQLGTMRRGLDMTVAYSVQRVQFGRPIGSFQALKHRMADLLVVVEMSRSASWAATDAAAEHLAEQTPDTAATLHRTAASAKAYCSDALHQVAAETIQIHGGIGITWEHQAHLVLKRAHSFGRLFGTARDHRATLIQ